jgi:hypothetical protein
MQNSRELENAHIESLSDAGKPSGCLEGFPAKLKSTADWKSFIPHIYIL